MESKFTSELLRTTLLRTGLIAIVLGTAFTSAVYSRSGSSNVPLLWFSFVLAVFWISFGGHWVELLYLRWWKPKFSREGYFRSFIERFLFWMAFGALLFPAARITQTAIYLGEFPSIHLLLESARGGLFAFPFIELVVHLVLYLLKQDSLFNGRG